MVEAPKGLLLLGASQVAHHHILKLVNVVALRVLIFPTEGALGLGLLVQIWKLPVDEPWELGVGEAKRVSVHAIQIIWLHVVHCLVIELHPPHIRALHLVLLSAHGLPTPQIGAHHARLEGVKLLLTVEELMLVRLRIVDHASLKIHSLLELLLLELVAPIALIHEQRPLGATRHLV